MHSSSRTERTATAQTITSTPTTPTTGRVAVTVTSLSAPSRRTGRPATDARRELCWCGQDMDVVRGSHCPRCGTMRSVRVGTRAAAVLPRLAA